jgi:DoxX-like family
MYYITLFLQLFVACGLLNVWVFRSHQKTPYRGSNSTSLKNEFAAYGLPLWSFYVVGFIKISSAFLLFLGFWKPFLVLPVAILVFFLMIGAICMHIKVKDSWKKFLPALIMLFSSIGLCIGSIYTHYT